MSILDDKRNINQSTIGDLIKDQRILSNRNVMLKNLKNLTESLAECEQYIDNVVNNKLKGDSDIGRMMNKCMGQFNNDDMKILEELVRTNFTDTMMINSLSKLQMAQINLTEKINTSFSVSLNKYLKNQNLKF